MIISCPNCHTKYNISQKLETELTSEQLRFKCVQCKTIWVEDAKKTTEETKEKKSNSNSEKTDKNPINKENINQFKTNTSIPYQSSYDNLDNVENKKTNDELLESFSNLQKILSTDTKEDSVLDNKLKLFDFKLSAESNIRANNDKLLVDTEKNEDYEEDDDSNTTLKQTTKNRQNLDVSDSNIPKSNYDEDFDSLFEEYDLPKEDVADPLFDDIEQELSKLDQEFSRNNKDVKQDNHQEKEIVNNTDNVKALNKDSSRENGEIERFSASVTDAQEDVQENKENISKVNQATPKEDSKDIHKPPIDQLDIKQIANSKVTDFAVVPIVSIKLKLLAYSILFINLILLAIVYQGKIEENFKFTKPIYNFFNWHNTQGLMITKTNVLVADHKIIKKLNLNSSAMYQLIIKISIYNNASTNRLLPNLNIEYINHEGKAVQNFMLSLPKYVLLPEETINLSQVTPYPTENVNKIIVKLGNSAEIFLLRH